MAEEKQEEVKKTTKADDLFGWFNNLIDLCKVSYERMQNLEKSNMELGVLHMKNRNYLDAAMRFRFVCWRNPKNFIAHYLQGKSYVFAGKYDKAIKPLRIALSDKPDLEEAKFLLATCGEKIDIKEIPPSILIEHLDVAAAVYDDEVILQSKLSPLVSKVVAEHFEGRQGFQVLHLDCRTGDAPEAIFARSDHMVGTDPSLKMISKARDKRVDDRLVYNELVGKTARDYLAQCEKKFDIIFTTNSFVNYKELEYFFEKAKELLKPNGVFLFNIMKSETEKAIYSNAEMVFTHSPEYIAELAEEFSFKIESQNEIKYEAGSNDLLMLLKKI